MRMLRVPLILALLIAACPRAQGDYDQWYVLKWGANRAGWTHATEVTEGEHITTTSVTNLELKRGQATIAIEAVLVWKETTDGEPIFITSSQKLGATEVETTWTFADGEIDVTKRQGERTTTSTMDVPTGDWLMPAEAGRRFTRLLEKEPASITQTLITPGMYGLQVMTTTYSDLKQASVEVMGKVVPAWQAHAVTDILPDFTSTVYLNNMGVSLRDEMNMGVATLTTIAADKSVALSDLDPPEIMAKTMVDPTGSLDEPPRSVRTASYIVHARTGDLSDLPDTSVQDVTRIDASTVRVVVDLTTPRGAGDVNRDRFLDASTVLDAEDQRIIELARTATAHVGDDPAARAEAMRRFVYDYIDTKTLGVGLATASEVCRTAQGDCSEHAVLLAAMLRAGGVPSRTVTGVVYVNRFLGQEDVFGYHMWTQALLDVNGESTWVDLDATLSADVAMDATHIALGVSAMADGEVFDGMVGLAPLVGNLEIEIEDKSSTHTSAP